jgi:hypothetical protein
MLFTFSFRERLAKILSAGQKATGMAGGFKRHQIINSQKNPCKLGVLYVFVRRIPRLASPVLNGCELVQPNARAVE